MPKKPLFLLGLILLSVIVITYSYRWIFFQTFIPTYFQEFYDHSQWSIPQSPRIMGDGELYQYAGYRLLQGDHPFGVNSEVPPVGKYLNAFAIGLFHNAFIFNLPLFLIALFLLYQITKQLTFSDRERLVAVLLFAASPLLFSQIGDTALDLFHVVTLLLYLIGLLALTQKPIGHRAYAPLIITGFGLGLFVGTKFGLFAVALLLPLIGILFQQKRLRLLFPIFAVAGLLYLGSYASYFWQGHTLAEWLQTQKWIVNFYLYSQAVKNPLVFLSVALTGIFSRQENWQRLGEWTLLWPLGIGGLILLSNSKPSLLPQRIIARVGLILVAINLIVPFAARYFLLILPLGIIAVIILFRRLPKILLWLLIAVCLIQGAVYLALAPEREISRLNQLLSTHRFDDLYFETSKPAGSWSQFSLPIHRFLYDIKADQADWKITKASNSLTKPTILFSSQYQTPIGPVAFQKEGKLINRLGKWQLLWDWEFIAPHFDPEAAIIYRQGDQVGGTLTTADGKNLSKGSVLPYLSVIPQNIVNEPELLSDLKKITGVDSLASRNLIHVDHPYTLNRRIGFVLPSFDQNIFAKLATNSAILITPENAPQSRLYPQGAIDKKYLPIIRHLESLHPELTNYIQGSIALKLNGQIYPIYTAPGTLPIDVTLSQTVNELLGSDAQIVF